MGDRVVLNWAISCGTCANCVAGVRHLCLNGSPIAGGMKGHADFNRSRYNGAGVYRAFNLGTMSTKTVVKAAAVTKLLTDVSFPVGGDRRVRRDDRLGLGGQRRSRARRFVGCRARMRRRRAQRDSGRTTRRRGPDHRASTRRRRGARWQLEFGATDALDPGDDDAGLLKMADVVKGMTHGPRS